MSVVGRAYGHRVDALAHLVEHLAEVAIRFGSFELGDGTAQRTLVDIALPKMLYSLSPTTSAPTRSVTS